jgi:hydroxymethylpyrimidine kinase/phosphomethylpyrimidine kinase
MTPPTALTIAGSDCSGGAGIQADLKTFSAFGVFGMSAVTAIVAENTVGVQHVHDVPLESIRQQIDSVATDIHPDAVKIGMLSLPVVVETVAEKIRAHRFERIVLDPVMVAKSGDPLLSEEARVTVRDELLPLADIITPNLHEAGALLEAEIGSLDEMEQAARELQRFGSRIVIVKGGHLAGSSEAVDVVWDGSEIHHLRSPIHDTKNTHGTGCTFSSAIAAGLAKGLAPTEAIEKAKRYISRAIETSLDLGAGHGPTNHLADIQSPW